MIINRNTKIFLIVFSVILLICTITIIVYTRTHDGLGSSQVIIESAPKTITNLNTNVVENSDDSTTKGATLQDSYNNNRITYKYKTRQKNNVEVTYPEISGLSSSNINKSINDQINERIDRILDSNTFKNNSDSSAYVSATVASNFSDVLSVKIFVKFTDNFSKNYGVNFRLDDGTRLKIDDLFTKNAPKKNIITFSAYRSFALDYYTEDGISNEFYTNIESDIWNFLTEYNSGKVTEFSFTPQIIELYREGRTIKIYMQDYYQYIAIYNKYKTSSDIYEDSYHNGKDIPIFVQRPNTIYDLYEKPNETCCIDVVIFDKKGKNDFSEKEMKIIKEYRNSLYSRLDTIRREQNVFYSNYVSVERKKEDGKDILVFYEDERYATIDENFENKIYNIILSAQRDVNSDNNPESKINELDENMIGSASVERKFDIETGSEIVEEVEEPQPEEENQNTTNNTINQTDTTNNTVTNQTTNSTSNTVTNSTEQGNNTNTNGEIDARVSF